MDPGDALGEMQEDRRETCRSAAQEQRGAAEAANKGLMEQLTTAASVHREANM